jgi:hypothetical protein
MKKTPWRNDMDKPIWRSRNKRWSLYFRDTGEAPYFVLYDIPKRGRSRVRFPHLTGPSTFVEGFGSSAPKLPKYVRAKVEELVVVHTDPSTFLENRS